MTGTKIAKLKPRLLECIERLKKLIELDAPAVVIGAAAWNVFATTLATYGVPAGSAMIDRIRDENLHQRGVCSYENCVNYANRPGLGLCADHLKELDLATNSEETE